ncbi:MAG TPA: long-chain N-acyl amino acid synthase [Pirellulales bacterium]|nr:long-chain N-acyl amino acid synthase [Pirellulales bacterium]
MPTFQLVCDENLSSPEAEGAPIVYKVAENRHEREAAFRLVYNAYTRSGLIEENPHAMRVTPYQLLDTTDVFIAMLDDELISTVSLVCDGNLGLPMEEIYGAEVAELRARGLCVAEVSCLADRRRQLSRTLPVFIPLMRLLAQAARYRGIEQLLVAVHPRHAGFYRRCLSFDLMGDEKTYPVVRNNPAVALSLDFPKLDKLRPVNFDRFFYDTFFGTQLPTTQLARHPMSDDERRFFGPAAEFGGAFTLVSPGDEQRVRGGAAVA